LRLRFGHHNAGRTEQTVTQFVALSELLDDLTLRDIRPFLLGNCFVPIGVEGFVYGIDLLKAAFEENSFELLKNHVDAGPERFHGLTLAGSGPCGQRILEIVPHGYESLQ